MALKHDIREPGETNTENMQDPIIAANPLDREYTKYNADIKSDIPGQIPDIPEPVQEKINVDFSEKAEDPIFKMGNGGAPGDGVGEHGETSGPVDHGSGDEGEEDSRVDFTQSEKFLMAKVVTGIGMEGLNVLNDFIISKWVITEDQVTKRILEGEADPDVLDYKINIGTSVIDIRQILMSNKSEVEKSFKFSKDEQKRITELLALILKDNNVQMKPEWMLVAILAQKYGIGIYTMNKINTDTKDLLDRVNYLIKVNKESHNIPSGPGVTMEHSDDKAPAAGKKQAKAAKVTKKPSAKPAAEAHDESDTSQNEVADNAAAMVAEMREPGEIEGNKVRRPKRTISKETMSQLAEDVTYTKVKD